MGGFGALGGSTDVTIPALRGSDNYGYERGDKDIRTVEVEDGWKEEGLFTGGFSSVVYKISKRSRQE